MHQPACAKRQETTIQFIVAYTYSQAHDRFIIYSSVCHEGRAKNSMSYWREVSSKQYAGEWPETCFQLALALPSWERSWYL